MKKTIAILLCLCLTIGGIGITATPSAQQTANSVKISAKYDAALIIMPDGSIRVGNNEVDLSHLGSPNIIDIDTGFNTYYAVTEDNRLLSWGDNLCGALGNPTIGWHTTQSTPDYVRDENGDILEDIVSISAGNLHALALNSYGEVFSFGRNNKGQLGIGPGEMPNDIPDDYPVHLISPLYPIDKNFAVHVPINAYIVQVATYGNTSYALDDSGFVWSWGEDEQGQLGVGFPQPSDYYQYSHTPILVREVGATTPTPLPPSDDPYYELYNNFYDAYYDEIPTPGTHLSGVTSIVSGFYHALAIKDDGSVWGWGMNLYGQLGESNSTGYTWLLADECTNISSLSDISTISAGYYTTFIIDGSGDLYSCGLGDDGQLADGGYNNGATHCVQYPNLVESGIIAVSAGNIATKAITDDGRILATGYNGFFEYGSYPIPSDIGFSFSNIIYYEDFQSENVYELYTDTQVLDQNGNYYADSSNITWSIAGSVGGVSITTDGTLSIFPNTFTANSFTITAAYDNGVHTAVVANKAITPVKIKEIDVAGNSYCTYLLKSDGIVWAAGSNANGMLGNNSTSTSSTPVKVAGENGVGHLEDIIAISAGYEHCLALDKDGVVWAWGNNDYGQLGETTANIPNSNVPVKIQGFDDKKIIKIAAGYYHSLAIDENNNLWSWGLNSYGQLGNNSVLNSHLPVKVLKGIDDPLTDVIDISAGSIHSVALVATDSNVNNNTVWAWGRNYYRQLGDGTATNSNIAIQVKIDSNTVLSNITAISSGSNHTIALDNTGKVWSWGAGSDNQLGYGSLANRTYAGKVYTNSSLNELSNVISISAGYLHNVAILGDSNRTKRIWGSNASGQLGFTRGTTAQYAVSDATAFNRLDDRTWRRNGTFNNTTRDRIWTTQSDIVPLTGNAIATGNNTFVMRDDGNNDMKIWGYGGNTNNKLGSGSNGSSSRFFLPLRAFGPLYESDLYGVSNYINSFGRAKQITIGTLIKGDLLRSTSDTSGYYYKFTAPPLSEMPNGLMIRSTPGISIKLFDSSQQEITSPDFNNGRYSSFTAGQTYYIRVSRRTNDSTLSISGHLYINSYELQVVATPAVNPTATGIGNVLVVNYDIPNPPHGLPNSGKLYITQRSYNYSTMATFEQDYGAATGNTNFKLGYSDFLIIDNRTSTNPKVKIVKSWRSNYYRKVVTEIVTDILLELEWEDPTNWNRTRHSLINEWVAHNNLYQRTSDGSTSTVDVDLDNNDEAVVWASKASPYASNMTRPQNNSATYGYFSPLTTINNNANQPLITSTYRWAGRH